MGCCQSEMKFEKGNIAQMVKECIEKNNLKVLLKSIENPEFQRDKEKTLEILDNVICNMKSLKLNALAYSLFLGRNSIFQALHKSGCSLQAAELLLQKQGVTAIALICCKGYCDMLSYYLPFYTESHNNDKPQDKTFTIDFNGDLEKMPESKLKSTAVHMAIQYNHIGIVTIINEFFKNSSQVPFELDLEYQDEISGENSALLACRHGNYPMVRFLHQKCGANFMIRNKVGESPIQIAAAGSRLHPHQQYLQIIMYLVDTVLVDVLYNYEETLLLVEDKEIIDFIEKKLKSHGITLKKKEIEKAATFIEKEKTDEVEDLVPNRRFNFMTMYAVSCGNKDDSLLSSISDQHSLDSIFGSTLSEFHQ